VPGRGGTTENGCECGSKGPQVRSPGGRLVVAGACCCILLLRDSARGGIPTEVLVGVNRKEGGGVAK
jgi:hypothetical protein